MNRHPSSPISPLSVPAWSAAALLACGLLVAGGCMTSGRSNMRTQRSSRPAAEEDSAYYEEEAPPSRSRTARTYRGEDAAHSSSSSRTRTSRSGALAAREAGEEAGEDETGAARPGSAASKTGAARRTQTAPAAGRRSVTPGEEAETGSGEDGDWSALTPQTSGVPKSSGLAVTPVQKAVAALIRELQDPLLADAAARRIWQAPAAAVPELIREVENPTLSKVERLQILVLDPDGGLEKEAFPGNRIHGLGRMEMVEEAARSGVRVILQGYTKMSFSASSNQKNAYRVMLEKSGGFPVGVVVRAGLLNRLKSPHYPDASDDDPGPGKLVDWWREYYRLARSENGREEAGK